MVPFWKDLERPGEVWAPLGASWGPLGSLLGASWRHLGASAGVVFTKAKIGYLRLRENASRSRLGTVLGPSWGRLGAILGPCWGHVGPILGHLGPSWAILSGLKREKATC